MKTQIRDIASIRSGYQFRGKVKEADDGNVLVVQIKDIDDEGELHTDQLARVHVESPERYEIHKGDVVFLSRGRKLMATEITEPLQNVIATSYYFILSPRTDSLLPSYLTWALNHSSFQRWLTESVQTTSIPWISKTDFEKLRLEVPPLNVQQKIVDLLSMHKIQEQLATKLITKRQQLIEAVCKQLMSGQLK